MMYDNDSNEWLNGFVYGIVMAIVCIATVEALIYAVWKMLS